MLTRVQRAYRFCRGDGSLSLAVAALILFIFVLYPMVEVGAARRIWLDLAFGLAMAFGAYFVFEPRPLAKIFLGTLAAAVIGRIAEHFAPLPWIVTLATVLTMAACTLFATLLMVRVMRDGRMNLNRLMGAIGSYLLIGIVFTLAYRLLSLHVPGAFAVGGSPVDYATITDKLTYFSFVTLTSTGYGDITPLHPYARSLATLEALTGGLFLTVLVARLVGLEMEWREEQRELRRRDADAAEALATRKVP